MARRHLFIVGAYVLLALVLTYPLVVQFGDHVPGTATWSMDEYGYVWNNWWFKHAVFDLGTSPFQTNLIFYPVGTSLVLYTFTLLHVLLGLPIQLLFGLIPASNAELLFAFVFCGYGAFLLAGYVIRKSPARALASSHPELASLAAFAGGAVYAFSSNRFVYASLGHYNVVGAEWVPFFVLFLLKTLDEPGYRNAILAGLFAACALYVETTDGVLLFLFTIVVLAFAGRRVLQRGSIARLAVVGATAAILFAPLLVPTLDEIFNSGYTLPGWGHAEKLLVDAFGFFTPTSLQPLNRHWVEELDQVRQGIGRFVDVNTVFLGYATVALALFAAVRYWNSLKVWAVSAVAFAVLSLGPLLHINGQSAFDLDGLQVSFPLPFLLLHYIPLLKENRVPNRFSILVMLSLAVLVSMAIAWLLNKVRQSPSTVMGGGLSLFAGLGLTAVLLFEHASVPLPLTDARVPEIYSQIAREPGDFAILTLPLGWRNSFGTLGAEDTRTQYYQAVHGKAIFPGNIQRNPPSLFAYFDRISLFHSLTQLELYQPVGDDAVARDRAQAAELMAFFDVRYVVVNPAVPGRPPYSDTRGAVLDYVRQVLPLGDKVYDQDGVVAYRVVQAPLPRKIQVQFGTDAAHLYEADGWDRDEMIAGVPANWANRSTARIVFPVRQVSDYALTLHALPFSFDQSHVQRMQVLVNGQPIKTFELKTGWQDCTATIPAGALHSGLNDLALAFSYAVRPYDVMPADYEVGGTAAQSPVDIVVNSGEFGSIKVNGKETSLLGNGYNVVVVDSKTGAVVGAKVFDTEQDRGQSRAMTDWIRQVPAGSIVAVAAQGRVAGNLGDGTVAALRSIGAQVDVRQNPGYTHAVIGVKGAAAGTALEQSQQGTSFIAVGRDPDERTLAAALSELTLEPE